MHKESYKSFIAKEEFDPEELAMGKKVEMEHANTIKKFMKDGVDVAEVAEAIARDHLKEMPDYYTKLKEMEGGKEEEPEEEE